MVKSKGYPTSLSSAAPRHRRAAEPGGGAASAGRLLRLAAAAALTLAALVVVRVAWNDLAAEQLLFEARGRRRAAPDSMARFEALRAALKANPHHPLALRDTAEGLLEIENKRMLAGQWQSMSVDNLGEGMVLLERASRTFPSRPIVLRTRGEAALMLGEVHALQGRKEDARASYESALKDMLASARELPIPRQGAAEFQTDVMRAAQRAGREDIVLEFLHVIARRRYRPTIASRKRENVSIQAAFTLGMFPQLVREVRYGLKRDSADEGFLSQIELAALRLGELASARSTLRELRDRGKLEALGLEALARVEEKAGRDAPGASPTITTEKTP